MVNRILIRTKVVQILYSYMLTKEEKTLTKAKNELRDSLDKYYELYNYLLLFVVDITDFEDRLIDDNRNKYLPSEEDLNPNMRFVENRLTELLRRSLKLKDFREQKHLSWRDDEIFLKLMLDKIKNSDEYKDYMAAENTDLKEDTQLWRQLFKQVILPDDDFLDEIESKSIYWSENDLDIAGQFASKTFRRFLETPDEDPIMPMYNDDEDEQYAQQLFTLTVAEMEANNDLIDRFINSERWDTERIALMDRIIMCTALTEIKHFESIPASVSINEFVEIAKVFSTDNSPGFINSMLHAIINALNYSRD